MTPLQLRKRIFSYYQAHGRHDLPWRHTKDPYEILVSEVMLQQTQVNRVIPKYDAWLKTFPTLTALAQAPTQKLLQQWMGLGYNNRALRLRECAREIVRNYKGEFPRDITTLESLPGIGPYTARAIATFAFEQSHIFIETNIRAVILHQFFKDKRGVDDQELLPYLSKVVARQNPRTMYYALMDYGSYLKSIHPNPSRKSKHHQKQSTFKGSFRQKRSMVTKLLLHAPQTTRSLRNATQFSPPLLKKVLSALQKDKIILYRNGRYEI
ncbi:A/G-specific adenine glycosylase [Candidatus Falkowbacteria bacterium]|nr:A/G-specific adenine glycosylase [Candidatus Falkowbacteria bacterium]